MKLNGKQYSYLFRINLNLRNFGNMRMHEHTVEIKEILSHLSNVETEVSIAKFTAFTWLDVNGAKRTNTRPRSRFWPRTQKNGRTRPRNRDGL